MESACGDKKCDGSCVCCNVFGTALGEIYRDSSKDITRIIGSAVARDPHTTQPRLAAIQAFYLDASALARRAFVNACISGKCCEGYAAALEGGIPAIILVAVSNAVNPLIPLGLPTDTAPGTVYGNLFIARQEIRDLIRTARRIAQCKRRDDDCRRRKCDEDEEF